MITANKASVSLLSFGKFVAPIANPTSIRLQSILIFIRVSAVASTTFSYKENSPSTYKTACLRFQFFHNIPSGNQGKRHNAVCFSLFEITTTVLCHSNLTIFLLCNYVTDWLRFYFDNKLESNHLQWVLPQLVFQHTLVLLT